MESYFFATRSQQTPKSLNLALQSYIPPNVWRQLDKTGLSISETGQDTVENYVRPLFQKNSGFMLRYGTPEKLQEELNSYLIFTGAHREFQNDPGHLLDISPPFFKSQRSRLFCYKQDSFVYLQNYLVERLKPEIIGSIVLAAYLKSLEAKLAGFLEFAWVNHAVQPRIDEEFVKAHEMVLASLEPAPECFSQEDVCNAIQNFVPDSLLNLPSLLELTFKDHPVETHPDYYSQLLQSLQMIIRIVDSLIYLFPTPFLPFPNRGLHFKVRLLRMFVDGRNKFFMVAELKMVAPVPSDMFHETFLTTIDEVEGKKLVGKVDVEYIEVPIDRSKHCAKPVRAPDAGYCKLAVDLLFELLQDLIFGVNVFQRLELGEWHELLQFFDNLKHHFDSSQEQVYFIRSSDYAKDESKRTNHFSKFLTRPVNTIRPVKTDGFTVEDLQNELVHLGFQKLFSSILNYAELVHAHVSSTKTGNRLQTSDMFDAVEHCLYISIFANVPELKRFLHRQNGCHRVLWTRCCSKSLVKKAQRFENTKWKSVSLENVEICNLEEEFKNKGMFHKKMTLSNGTELVYNDSAYMMILDEVLQNSPAEMRTLLQKKFDDNKDNRVFYVPRQSLDFVLNHHRKTAHVNPVLTAGKDIQLLSSFSVFQDVYLVDDILYLRTFIVCPIDREGSRIVFLEEVREMIHILLARQGDSLAEIDVAAFFNEWKERNVGRMAINLKELDEILLHFDIDKTRITLVPDMVQAFSITYKICLNTGCPFMIIYGPDKRKLVEVSQAIFRVFQEVVCDVNWLEEVLDDPAVSMEKFKADILKTVTKCFNYNDFAPLEDIDKMIKTLQNHPNYLERKKRMLVTPLMKLYDCDYNDTTDLYFFLSECYKFRIGVDTPPDPRAKNQMFPCWKFRLMFLSSWCDIFFPVDSHYHSIVRTGIFHRAPLYLWDSPDDFEDLILMKTEQKQSHAMFLATTSSIYLNGVNKHKWLKETRWQDRTYIRRCPKWEILDLIEKYRETSDTSLLHMVKKKKENLVVSALQFYKESCKQEKATAKLIVKLGVWNTSPAVESVESSKPAARKGKPAAKNCNDCEPISRENAKLTIEVKDLKAEYEKAKLKAAQADKNLKNWEKREKDLKPRKDLEKEIREGKKRIEELEQESLAQEQKDEEFQKQLLAVQKTIEELNKKNKELEKFNKEKDEKIMAFQQKLTDQ